MEYSMRVLVVVAASVLCMVMAEQGGVLGSVILRNASNKVVTVSWDASNPTAPMLVLGPGEITTLPLGTYYLTNVKPAQVYFPLDTRLYAIRDAALSVGLVQVYLVALGSGTVGPVSDAVPITGEF